MNEITFVNGSKIRFKDEKIQAPLRGSTMNYFYCIMDEQNSTQEPSNTEDISGQGQETPESK